MKMSVVHGLLTCAIIAIIQISHLQLVSATCEGNSCPAEHAAATSSGLLGGSNSCAAKTYPKDGSKLEGVDTGTALLDVVWAGVRDDQDKYVFATSRSEGIIPGGALWRSDYYGIASSWKNVTSKLTGVKAGYIGVTEIIYSADVPEGEVQKMLFQGPGYAHWTSTDMGATFTEVPTPAGTLGYGSEIRQHPTKQDYLLARVRRNECSDRATRTSRWCAYDLFVSTDFARSWTNLTANSKGRIASFYDFDWGANVYRHADKSGPPDETIFATAYEDPAKMKGPLPGWDKDLHFVQSGDFFQTQHEKLASCGNQFEVVSGKVFLAMPADCPYNPDGSSRSIPSGTQGGNNVVLFVSSDEAKTFTEACLPVKHLDLSYNLVRAHNESGAFVIVDHDEDEMAAAWAPIANVYGLGGGQTSLFSLSLRRNYKQGYATDFARVEGVPGVYLANQLDARMLDDPEALPDSDFFDYVQTKVSFTGGAHWEDLEKPKTYRYPECNGCSSLKDPSTCQLHLHGPSSWHYGYDARPSYYSHSSAPGIVMAVGNTGDHLDFAADDTCTFLTRDGGLTWEDVVPHTAIYEFGDHGGIIVMSKHETTGPTDIISFSLDEGLCWHNITLSEAIDVQNIRVEPRGASHVFMVHGIACRKTSLHPKCTWDPSVARGSSPQGKLFPLDIKALLGSDFTDCSAADYEPWSPPAPSQCLLGQNYTLQRQKRSSTCFNGDDYKHPKPTTVPCPCAHADVECEYGFEFVDSECVPMPDLDPKQCPILKENGGSYRTSSTHRRLVSGDLCSNVTLVIADTDGAGGLPLPPVNPSGGGGGHGGHSGWFTFFMVLLVFGIIGGAFWAWWTFLASESAKDRIEEISAPAVAVAGSAWGWVLDRTAGLTGQRRAEEAYFQPLSGGEGLHLDEEDARSPPLFASPH